MTKFDDRYKCELCASPMVVAPEIRGNTMYMCGSSCLASKHRGYQTWGCAELERILSEGSPIVPPENGKLYFISDKPDNRSQCPYCESPGKNRANIRRPFYFMCGTDVNKEWTHRTWLCKEIETRRTNKANKTGSLTNGEPDATHGLPLR